MAVIAVARYFGFALLVIGGSMAAPAVVALVTSDPSAGNFVFGGATCFLFGGGLILFAGRPRPITSFKTTLVLITLWWSLAPVFGALPFWLSGWSLADGYFETVSALTTTGSTLAGGDLGDDSPELIWRAILQWIGGLSSLAIAAAIFIRPAFVGADTTLPSFSRGDGDSYVHAIVSAVRAFGGIYALITLVMFAALSAVGLSMIDAMTISMSTAASGGMIPHADGLRGYAPSVSLIIVPFIMLSGINFILIDRGLRGKAARLRDNESLAFLALVAIVAFCLWLMAGGAGPVAPLFNAASLFATNGITIGAPPGLVFSLVIVIIGGSAVSTAGGLKILRWIVIMRRTNSEVRQLIFPSAVFAAKVRQNELGVWMHFLVFTIVLGLLTAAVTAGGHSFETAVAGAVGALANAGPVIILTERGAEGYRVFDDTAVRLVLVAGMILGRLEGVAALMLINRTFWRG